MLRHRLVLIPAASISELALTRFITDTQFNALEHHITGDKGKWRCRRMCVLTAPPYCSSFSYRIATLPTVLSFAIW